jgi:hypothetical protein
MRRTFLTLGFLLCLAGAAFAQAPPVAQTATRQDAATVVCSTAPAVNATAATGTCTVVPPAGQFLYLVALYVAACGDGTASTSSIQQNFTTTNLNGLVIETSYLSAATIATNPGASQCDRVSMPFATPLKSAAAGSTVTIVPPAQAAHMSFPIVALGYFAP